MPDKNYPTSAAVTATGQNDVRRRWLRGFVLLLTFIVASLALFTTGIPALPNAIAQATQPTEPPAAILLSASSHGVVPLELVAASGSDDTSAPLVRLAYRDEDILAFDPAKKTYSVFFNAEARGLAAADVEDFEFLADENILIFTLDKSFNIPNPNGSPNPLRVDDSDIVAWDRSTDSFSIYLTGAALGLTTSSEDIDALGITAEGDLLISTIGSARVDGPSGRVSASDEDLLKCSPTTNTCVLYFDGSKMSFNSGREDINAVWLDLTPGHDPNLYLSTKDRFEVEGENGELEGRKNDVFICTPLDSDPITQCHFEKFFQGNRADYKTGIDGVAISFAPIVNSTDVLPAASDEEKPGDPVDIAEYLEALQAGDPEIDVFDFFEMVEILLPLIQR